MYKVLFVVLLIIMYYGDCSHSTLREHGSAWIKLWRFGIEARIKPTFSMREGYVRYVKIGKYYISAFKD